MELFIVIKTLLFDFSRVLVFPKDILQNDPAAKEILDPIFDNIFSANELGLNKKDPQGYKIIAEKLGVKPNEILFIDDSIENVKAAQNAGLQAVQFVSNKQLIPWLKQNV